MEPRTVSDFTRHFSGLPDDSDRLDCPRHAARVCQISVIAVAVPMKGGSRVSRTLRKSSKPDGNRVPSRAAEMTRDLIGAN
jgi:tRNA(Met) C34 N-acetyltransferase TmcA